MLVRREDREPLRVVVPAAAGAPLRFAAAELGRYLGAMRGAELPLIPDAALAGAQLLLEAGGGASQRCAEPVVADAADAFAVAAGDTSARIAGGSERAVLHAVYRLLEEAGCRWSPFGGERESVPALPAAGWSVPELRAAPTFAVRAYATDIHTYHYQEPEWLERRLAAERAFVDWMGKTAANSFLFIRHPFDERFSMPELLAEFEPRGIVPEYGGHVLPLLLPRAMLAAHPDYFPADRGGRRHDLGNLCTSSAGALRQVRSAAVDCVERHPELGVLHVWGADYWDGGWCHCSACERLSVQDQSLRVCNAVAEALEAAGRARPVCYLAYHDTIRPDLEGRPHPNVWAEFAPRERCYGHALDDPACETNRPYRESCERHAEIFAGRLRIFEYYGDAILFCGVAVPLPRVIAADLDFYRRCGAREISFLQFGSYSLWAHPLNFLAFAEGTRRIEGRLAGSAAGARGESVLGYPETFWRELEEIMAAVVTYGDVRRPPPRRASAIAARLAEASENLRACVRRIDADPLAQRPLLESTAAVLDGVRLDAGGDSAAAEECYARALDVVAGVDEALAGVWGRRDLAVIHRFHSAASRRS